MHDRLHGNDRREKEVFKCAPIAMNWLYSHALQTTF